MVVALSFCIGCATHRGSSSLGPVNGSSSATPRIKSDEQLKAQADAATNAAKQLSEQAKSQAQSAVDAAKQRAKDDADAAKKKVTEEARQIQQNAENKANEAKQKAEDVADAALDATITVKEEAVKIIETTGTEEVVGNYHIIIGSFKVLANAQTLSEQALKNEFSPSILENEEGMYRVSIFTCELEKTARRKIAEIRSRYPEYVGTWLLISK
ncbi:MAG: SPOR domain-containing protein [Bacteroidales bacterium]|nr:SPOR domain-containing protein [Bacteroidales bacterium]